MLIILLSPVIVSLLMITVWKKSGFSAGLFGIVWAVALSVVLQATYLNGEVLLKTLSNSLVLTLNAFAVIFTGLMLGLLLKQTGQTKQLDKRLSELPLHQTAKISLLLFGLLPALESITGFGVSLLLAVPVFMAMFPRQAAMKLSLLSMNIMPWGTLGLATIVAANLTQQNIASLGSASALISFGVFPCIAVIAAYLIGGNSARHYFLPLAAAVSFSVLLLAFNLLGWVELAGAMAGFVNFVLWFFILNASNRNNPFPELKLLFKQLSPYLWVVLLVLLIKIIAVSFPNITEQLSVSGDSSHFYLLKSPGLALLSATLLWAWKTKQKPSLPWKQSYKTCSTLFVFIVLSQFLFFAGFIEAFIQTIPKNSSIWLYLFISPLLGMLSGFIAGSNLGANALLINMQEQIGAMFHHELLFAALQNSSAGHTVFVSLPIIILALSIADAVGKPADEKAEQSELLKFGFKSAGLMYIAYIISAAIYYIWK
ncbi:L-lactate permease [Stenoxybacter acetivorans]|uniref:L-lactate permease n=1 Tax=Stenoxybacter acetivorans TaxID=422441 RepID=UPI000564BD39|nr:L-lactate permease [Stenoxybacter acetivorans]